MGIVRTPASDNAHITGQNALTEQGIRQGLAVSGYMLLYNVNTL